VLSRDAIPVGLHDASSGTTLDAPRVTTERLGGAHRKKMVHLVRFCVSVEMNRLISYLVCCAGQSDRTRTVFGDLEDVTCYLTSTEQ
jgi:hypothetical protein